MLGLWVFYSTAIADTTSTPVDLSLQELLDIEVVSVSKQAEPLSNSAAAIYAITADDIRRSGARSIPQALRTVPGLHVAQIDSQKWAVSSRGFNGRYNNKMLVLMDGRTLYSPEFSGVYWEAQDILMADIERIEIVRGPSAAMWGANAVNGVINIITKHSSETLGGYAELGAGDYEQGFAGFRYGGKLAEGVTARAYAKAFQRDELDFNQADVSAADASRLASIDTDNQWSHQQLGGRMDINLSAAESLRLSSAIYQSQSHQVANVATTIAPYSEFIEDDFDSRGWHLMGDYTKAISATSELNLTAYFDHAKREEFVLGFSRDTFDIELNHRFGAGDRHDILWGLGYRHISNELDTAANILVDSDTEKLNLWSAFVQDRITLIPDALWLTIATRFEHHSYTNTEWQPTARLMWQLTEKHRFWAAISRAVRTPSQLESAAGIHLATLSPANPFNTFGVPIAFVLQGNDSYDSEEVDAVEIGYRFASDKHVSLDMTMFYNDYDELRTTSGLLYDLSNLPNFVSASTNFDNGAKGENYGFEMSANWLVSDSFKLRLNYGYIYSDFDRAQSQNTDAPEQIVSLIADWNISPQLDFSASWRYVDRNELIDPLQITSSSTEDYQGVDLSLNWQLTPDVRLSAFAYNLFYGSHVEYKAETFSIPYRVEPSYFGMVTVAF
jgi:iron complex outermembrane receptor protein